MARRSSLGDVKLIVGLGNPGARYRGTRHNLGFDVVDELAARRGVRFADGPAEALVAAIPPDAPVALLAKPLTYMNRSGTAVRDLLQAYGLDLTDLLVVADDVNLPVGHVRARARGSAGGHQGLQSIIDALGTEEFARLRIGIGRAAGPLEEYVLERFRPEERVLIQEAVVRAADAVELFLSDGIDEVMNRYNRKVSSETA